MDLGSQEEWTSDWGGFLQGCDDGMGQSTAASYTCLHGISGSRCIDNDTPVATIDASKQTRLELALMSDLKTCLCVVSVRDPDC